MVIKILGVVLAIGLVLQGCKGAEEGLVCKICKMSVVMLKLACTSDFVLGIYLQIDYMNCVQTYSPQHCEERKNLVSRPNYIAQFRAINGDEICTKMQICTAAKYVPDSTHAYMSHVLKHNPPFMAYEGVADVKHALRFLVVADIHIDYDYIEVREQSEPAVESLDRVHERDLLPQGLARNKRHQ
jgi:hypothetical protein